MVQVRSYPSFGADTNSSCPCTSFWRYTAARFRRLSGNFRYITSCKSMPITTSCHVYFLFSVMFFILQRYSVASAAVWARVAGVAAQLSSTFLPNFLCYMHTFSMTTRARLHFNSPEIPEHHPLVTIGPSEPPDSSIDAQLRVNNDVEHMSEGSSWMFTIFRQ